MACRPIKPWSEHPLKCSSVRRSERVAEILLLHFPTTRIFVVVVNLFSGFLELVEYRLLYFIWFLVSRAHLHFQCVLERISEDLEFRFEKRKRQREKMYVVPPPKRSDPLSGSTNGQDNLRIYQTWKGSNVSVLLLDLFGSTRFVEVLVKNVSWISVMATCFLISW